MGAPLTAKAVDLTGMTLTAHGIATTMSAVGVEDTITWTLHIYFGSKGDRFVFLDGTRGDKTFNVTTSRVLVPAGSDKGSKRGKDFTTVVKLQQSGGTLVAKVETRVYKQDTGGKGGNDFIPGQGFTYNTVDTGRFDVVNAHSSYIYTINLGSGSCSVADYRYLADASLGFRRTTAKEGDCMLRKGLPSDLAGG
jgi:hypothetical protein